jgi:hypothetical protein
MWEAAHIAAGAHVQSRRETGAELHCCIAALLVLSQPRPATLAPRSILDPTRATPELPERRTDPSAIGTILSTIGIAVAASGGGDKAAASTSAPPPVKEDASINTGNSEEDEL